MIGAFDSARGSTVEILDPACLPSLLHGRRGSRLVGVTKRVAATLALALVLVGCEAFDTPVPLLTGSGLSGGCFTNHADGPLVVDPTYGTAIIDMDAVAGAPPGLPPPSPIPVAWRPGFTGRRVGSEVEVLDPHGKVVAVTGHKYSIAGGYVGPGSMGSWPELSTNVFWACDMVFPKP